MFVRAVGRALRVCVPGGGRVCLWIVRGGVRQGLGHDPGTPRVSQPFVGVCVCVSRVVGGRSVNVHAPAQVHGVYGNGTPDARKRVKK